MTSATPGSDRTKLWGNCVIKSFKVLYWSYLKKNGLLLNYFLHGGHICSLFYSFLRTHIFMELSSGLGEDHASIQINKDLLPTWKEMRRVATFNLSSINSYIMGFGRLKGEKKAARWSIFRL